MVTSTIWMLVAGGGGHGSPVSSGPAVESTAAVLEPGSSVVSSAVPGDGAVVPSEEVEPVVVASSPSLVAVPPPGLQASVADRHEPRIERFMVGRV